MSPDDVTPIKHHRSGEWTEMDEIRTQLRDIGKKLDRALEGHSEDRRTVVAMDTRLSVAEEWIKEEKSERRQTSLGTKLAIIGQILTVIGIIVVFALKH